MELEPSFNFTSLLDEKEKEKERPDLAETDDEEESESEPEHWDSESDDDEIPIDQQEKEDPFPVCATFWVRVVDDLLTANKVSYERHLEELRVPETGEREFDLARGKKRFKVIHASASGCDSFDLNSQVPSVYLCDLDSTIRIATASPSTRAAEALRSAKATAE